MTSKTARPQKLKPAPVKEAAAPAPLNFLKWTKSVHGTSPLDQLKSYCDLFFQIGKSSEQNYENQIVWIASVIKTGQASKVIRKDQSAKKLTDFFYSGLLGSELNVHLAEKSKKLNDMRDQLLRYLRTV